MYVLTLPNPNAANDARSCSILMILCPLTLIPRSMAIYVGICGSPPNLIKLSPAASPNMAMEQNCRTHSRTNPPPVSTHQFPDNQKKNCTHRDYCAKSHLNRSAT